MRDGGLGDAAACAKPSLAGGEASLGLGFHFLLSFQPGAQCPLTGPCSVLLPGQAAPVSASAGDCHLTTGTGQVGLRGQKGAGEWR